MTDKGIKARILQRETCMLGWPGTREGNGQHRRRIGESDPGLVRQTVSRRQRLVVWEGLHVAESAGRMEWGELSVASERAL